MEEDSKGSYLMVLMVAKPFSTGSGVFVRSCDSPRGAIARFSSFNSQRLKSSFVRQTHSIIKASNDEVSRWGRDVADG